MGRAPDWGLKARFLVEATAARRQALARRESGRRRRAGRGAGGAGGAGLGRGPAPASGPGVGGCSAATLAEKPGGLPA